MSKRRTRKESVDRFAPDWDSEREFISFTTNVSVSNTPSSPRTAKYTSKQMGDACEMLVAAEMTLAGIPALKVPDSWPGYDVVAQPIDGPAQRISVKARTFKRGGSTFV